MAKHLPPVDDDVFAALQALAEPLVDDVNSVLRRLLGLADATSSNGTRASLALAAPAPMPALDGAPERRSPRKPTPKKRSAAKAPKARAPRGSLLPESEYELPMLRFLASAGGRAPASEVVEAVGAALGDRFTPTDREALGSGEIRWKSRVQFVRLKLIREGAMVKEAPRGVWEISEVGRERVLAEGAVA